MVHFWPRLRHEPMSGSINFKVQRLHVSQSSPLVSLPQVEYQRDTSKTSHDIGRWPSILKIIF